VSRDRRALGLALLVGVALGCDAKPPSSIPPSGGPGPSAIAIASSEPGRTAAPIEKTPACELIFKAEVAAAVGVEIDDAQEIPTSSEDGGWLADCIYWRQSFHDQAPMELTLGSGKRYVDFFESLKALDGVTAADGLGDEGLLRLATVPGLEGPVGALFVRIGGAVLGLSLGIVGLAADGTPELAGDAAKQTQVLTDLARLAIGRLTGPPVVSAKICELLSATEAGALVGATFTEAVDADDHDIWGPSCRYLPGTAPNQLEKFIDLWVAVSSAPTARPHFDACRSAGAAAPGLGDEAFYASYQQAECQVKIGFFFSASPLLVRSGDTVIALGYRSGGQLDSGKFRAAFPAVARAILTKLGASPGATTPPVRADVLANPCLLATDAEVTAIMGATITAHYEFPADASGNRASCGYSVGLSGIDTVGLKLGQGEAALGSFNSEYRRTDYWHALEGFGDEAYTQQEKNETDQPLVAVALRKGDVVLVLRLGPVRESADFLSYVAPGTPDQQLAMIRKLVDLMLPRLFAG
jgi:hypothetical protein